MKIASAAFMLAALVGCSGSPDDPPPDPPTTTASTPETNGGTQDHTGGQDARSTTASSTAGAFGAACTSGADCASATCFTGGKGGFCSLKCAADADCPQPSTGAPHCNPHGYCRY